MGQHLPGQGVLDESTAGFVSVYAGTRSYPGCAPSWSPPTSCSASAPSWATSSAPWSWDGPGCFASRPTATAGPVHPRGRLSHPGARHRRRAGTGEPACGGGTVVSSRSFDARRAQSARASDVHAKGEVGVPYDDIARIVSDRLTEDHLVIPASLSTGRHRARGEGPRRLPMQRGLASMFLGGSRCPSRAGPVETARRALAMAASR